MRIFLVALLCAVLSLPLYAKDKKGAKKGKKKAAVCGVETSKKSKKKFVWVALSKKQSAHLAKTFKKSKKKKKDKRAQLFLNKEQKAGLGKIFKAKIRSSVTISAGNFSAGGRWVFPMSLGYKILPEPKKGKKKTKKGK